MNPIYKVLIQRKAFKLEKKLDPLKIDLGCGPLPKSGHIGLDLSNDSDIQWDIRVGLPFSDNSVEKINTDHFLEHLELVYVVFVLKECYRVLKSGGILELSVPHLDPYLQAYLSGDVEFLKEKISDIPKGQDYLYATPFDIISWLLLRSGEHKSLFDKNSIIAKVKLAGFSNIEILENSPENTFNYRYSSILLRAKKEKSDDDEKFY